MDNDGIKDWPRLLYDELPNVVKPLFGLCVFLIVFLTIGNNLKLNDSLWLITKEGAFNLAFYLGMFTFVFRALNKAPQKLREINFARKYPRNKLNQSYFLGQYDGHNEVYVFELQNEKKKLWVANPQTRRFLWEHDDITSLNPLFKTVPGKSIDLTLYPDVTKYDGKIDILNPGEKDNAILFSLSTILIIGLLVLFNGMRIIDFLQHINFFKIPIIPSKL